MRKILLGMLAVVVIYAVYLLNSNPVPKGFTWISAVDPTIKVYARFATSYNCMGKPLPGYYTKKDVLLTNEAAAKLVEVQIALKEFGYGLVIYDGYRPQYANIAMIDWAKDPRQRGEKSLYFPNVDKADLVSLGYLSELSENSRGSTVDVSLISLGHELGTPQPSERSLKNGRVIPYLEDGSADMGSSYGLFDEVSATDSPLVDDDQYKLRILLKSTMSAHEFLNNDKEWWRYTLSDEPHPNMYYNFEAK